MSFCFMSIRSGCLKKAARSLLMEDITVDLNWTQVKYRNLKKRFFF
jgi:hypothetical protein